MIRACQTTDIPQIMELWLKGNLDAHPFIPADYWYSNYAAVQKQLPQADIFVFEANGIVQGFMGIINDYIAGIFVDNTCRSCGIGAQLLEYAKQTHSRLSLNVYQKNTRALSFYLREGFSFHSEAREDATGELEYTMCWEENPSCPDDWELLYRAAKSVQHSQIISDFVEAGQVAAALMTDSRHIYTGVCIDTACSLGMCAERNAIAHMLTCGESHITKLVVAGHGDSVLMPCGSCCELMMQLTTHAAEIEILKSRTGSETVYLKELLPHWWGINR